MPAPSVLPGRAFQQATRKSNLLFHWRARDLTLTTRTGDAGTFTRASAGGHVMMRGMYHDHDPGYERRLSGEASDNVPRWSWMLNNATGLYEPVLLLERAYTNLVTSDDFDAGWTSFGSPVITTGVDDPAAGTSAYRIADDDGAITEGKRFGITFTGDGTKCAVFVVREATMPASGNQRVGISDDTAGVWTLQLNISAWVGGEPTVAAVFGTLLGKQYVGNGYWALYGQTSSVTAANTNRAYVYPATTAAATGSIDIYRAMAFNAAVPPASILDAGVTKAADALTFPFPSKPVAATYLYEGVVLDLPNTGAYRWLWNIGNVGSTGAHLGSWYRDNSNQIGIDFGNGSTYVTGYWAVPSIALGDYIAIRIYQAPNGAITAGLTINGGAEDTTLDGAVSTQALPTVWANNVLRFGHPVGATTCNSGLISFKAARGGPYTLQQMMEAY